jgi:predicted amidophosphoribosyltransferase
VGDGACGACARPRLPFAPPRGRRCGRCAREPRGGVRRTVALYRYTLAGRDLLRHLKFHGRRDAAAPLGRALALAVARELPEIVGADRVALVTSVPTHWTRRLLRGYDHVELVGRSVARELGLPFERSLRRVRRTRALFSVPRQEREDELKGAVSAQDSVAGRWVLLVDDIRTSGATLATCGRALRDRGALRVDAAVVGR